ncbi:MAG: beta strand repeat-containing protein [Gemmatimonadaceae bacterium]
MQCSSRWSVVRVSTALALLFAASSCDTPLETEVDGVGRVVLAPGSASLQVGATVTLTALVLDNAGNAMRERKVVWASENASIATVSQSGVVTGVTAGTVQVAASSGGKSANAAITVTPRPVTLVRITPGSATISVTGSVTLQVEALDASGAPVVGRPISWSSSNETIAVVSANGVVAGIAAGSVTITATIDGQSGTAVVTVAPQPVASVSITPTNDTTIVGRRRTFRATPLDGQNLPLTGRTPVWTSSNPVIATVTSAGEALGLAVGTAQIRATIEGRFAEATIVVLPVPVARVVTNPNQITLNPGQTSQLTVTLTDSAGNILSGRAITYLSSNATIATVSNTGLITAVAEGSAQIEASSEGKTATTVVTVNPVPVASMTITPSTVALGIAQTTRLTAQAFDAGGRPLANRKFTWISGAPTVATVNQSGDVTAVAGGTAVIFAATEGISASATVSVTASVSTVSVAPANPTLSVGQTIGMTAILRDVNGIILTGRVVGWSSSNPAIASVNSSNGVVTAVASGTATITASSEGKTGGTNVTVSVIPVGRVDVLPTTVALNPGQTSQLTATVYDQSNNVLQRQVTWSSNNQSVASVSNTGQVTAVSSGTATISATSGGVSGTAVVTVALVPVANVTVTPTTPNMFPGDVLTLTATARDAGGNVITGRPTTWSSSNTAVATVVATTGVVTAVTSGAATITATVDGVSGSATVTINQTPVASVTLAPASASLFVGQQTGFIATARDASGNVLPRPITWSTTNPTVIINVTQAGVVTGINPGTEGVIAMAVGAGAGGTNVGDTATVNVSLVPVASISISPSPVNIFTGQQQQLTVQLRDGSGNPLSTAGRTITWSSLNPAVATVSTNGLVTAASPGNTQVVVSTPGATGNVADTTSITVSPSPIVSVVVTPKPNTIYQGATKSLRAVITNASSTILRGRNVSWQVRPNPFVSVSPVAGTPDSATYTAVALGTTYVIAEDPSGLRDSTLVTVQPVPVTSVVVTPASATVNLADSAQLNAVARDSAGNALPRPITWSSSAPGVASVSSTGMVTALAAGSATITATASGAGVGGVNVSGTASITAHNAVSTVTVSSARSFVVPGDTLHLNVQLKDVNGNTITGRPITFSTSDPGATVDAAGIVTGVGAGPVTITATSEGKTGTIAVSAISAISNIAVAGPGGASDNVIASPVTSKVLTVTVAGGAGAYTFSVASSNTGVATVSASTITTNVGGTATVTVTAVAPGATTITFTAARQGAIPPGTAGNNSAVQTFNITVQ